MFKTAVALSALFAMASAGSILKVVPAAVSHTSRVDANIPLAGVKVAPVAVTAPLATVAAAPVLSAHGPGVAFVNGFNGLHGVVGTTVVGAGPFTTVVGGVVPVSTVVGLDSLTGLTGLAGPVATNPALGTVAVAPAAAVVSAPVTKIVG